MARRLCSEYHFNWKTISVAAAMTLWNFYFQIFEKAIAKEQIVVFLENLARHIAAPTLIIWDRLPAHRSRLVAEFVESLDGLIVLESLPAYAPELNPVEYLWGSHRTMERSPASRPGAVAPVQRPSQRRRSTDFA